MLNQPLLQIDQLLLAPPVSGPASGHDSAITPLSLDFAAGQFHVLAGPDLRPLAYLLRLIAGFEPLPAVPAPGFSGGSRGNGAAQPAQGQIRLGGQWITHLPLGQRHVASLSWEPRLFPHLTIGRNIVFPLTHQAGPGRGRAHAAGLTGKSQADAATAAAMAAVRVGLSARMLDLYPADLPLRAQLRAALARALALSPALLLLTDPLLPLSAAEAADFARDLRRLQRDLGLTILCATERLAVWAPLADQVTMLDEAGRLVQRGSMEEIYHRPASLQAARLAGPVNLLPVEITGREITGRDAEGRETGRIFCRCPGNEPREIVLPLHQVAPSLAGLDHLAHPEQGLHAHLLLRPHVLRPGLGIRRQDCRLEGRVRDRTGDGAMLTLQVDVTGLDRPVTVTFPAPAPFPMELGMALGLGWNIADCHLLPLDGAILPPAARDVAAPATATATATPPAAAEAAVRPDAPQPVQTPGIAIAAATTAAAVTASTVAGAVATPAEAPAQAEIAARAEIPALDAIPAQAEMSAQAGALPPAETPIASEPAQAIAPETATADRLTPAADAPAADAVRLMLSVPAHSEAQLPAGSQTDAPAMEAATSQAPISASTDMTNPAAATDASSATTPSDATPGLPSAEPADAVLDDLRKDDVIPRGAPADMTDAPSTITLETAPLVAARATATTESLTENTSESAMSESASGESPSDESPRDEGAGQAAETVSGLAARDGEVSGQDPAVDEQTADGRTAPGAHDADAAEPAGKDGDATDMSAHDAAAHHDGTHDNPESDDPKSGDAEDETAEGGRRVDNRGVWNSNAHDKAGDNKTGGDTAKIETDEDAGEEPLSPLSSPAG